ncbi:MAG TPA: iron-sulfur cluster assembly protein, partial [Caulobacteraceae bacterium]|nr:iron-sulfur cluster assembly protein [Caulobacteraceae bacterium]
MDPLQPTDRDAALKALDGVTDPRTGRGLVSAGLVQGLVVRDGKAGFMIEVPASAAGAYGSVREEAEKVLAALPGIEKAQVVLTTALADAATTRIRKGARLTADPQAQPQPPVAATRPAHVKRVLAVASGKGGVGKSTVAVNLACAFV